MTAITVSSQAKASTFAFIRNAIKGYRRRRTRTAQREHLLSVDNYLLRDMGLDRIDVLYGSF